MENSIDIPEEELRKICTAITKYLDSKGFDKNELERINKNRPTKGKILDLVIKG